MRARLVTLTLLVGLALPGLGKAPPTRYVQTHVSLTLSCQDLAGAMTGLQTLTGQLQGVVTNSNLQLESGSANANLRLPPDQVPAFLAKVRSLGDVQNENVSTSDNTRSYEDATANLQLAEKMAAADWQPRTPVSPADRLQFEAEFKSYLRDRINSHRGNLASYEDYRKWAEVSVSLQGQRRVTAPLQEIPVPSPLVEGPPQPQDQPQQQRNAAVLIIPSVFLGVCLAYFLFSRRRPS